MIRHRYEPESGALRPSSGDNIDIVGGLSNDSSQVPMIIVYELNGETWRTLHFSTIILAAG
ncbi:MAG: hypothetical protein U5K00_04170 [Melioribacteraceae bacterium]|nr:hypothetical protein [Melioribacteraceae bacterium]